MSTLTNKNERYAEQAIHGILNTDNVGDPTDFELALFIQQPAAESESAFGYEVAVGGYTRQPVVMEVGSEKVVNKADIVFDGNDVTDSTQALATHFALCRKRRLDLPLFNDQGIAGKQLLPNIPSLSVENVSSGTFTGSAKYIGYLNTSYSVEKHPKFRVVSGVTLVDTAANFSNDGDDWIDPFGNPARYIVITTGPLRGAKFIVMGRTASDTLVLAAPTDNASGMVGTEHHLTGVGYTLRNFPTVESVFGPVGSQPLVEATVWGDADRIEFNQPGPVGLYLANATHDSGNNKITFDALESPQLIDLQAAIAADPRVRLVFPGNASTYSQGYVIKDITSVTATEIVYTPGTNTVLLEPDFAFSAEPFVSINAEYLRANQVGQGLAAIFANTTLGYWTRTTGTSNYGKAVLPIVDMAMAGGSFAPYNGSTTVGGLVAGVGLLPYVTIEYDSQNYDTSFVYHATKNLASEIVWTSEIKDLGGAAAPVVYGPDNSVRFEAGALEFFIN